MRPEFLLLVVGVICVVAGAAMLSLPWAFIAAGLLIILITLATAWIETR